MAFVAPPSSPLVRATVDQEDIDLVRNHRRAAHVTRLDRIVLRS